MGDSILLFLTADVAALLVLGALTVVASWSGANIVLAGLCGFGVVLSLASLLPYVTLAAFTLPIGPPGLSLHFSLDPLAACFLLPIFVAGSALAVEKPAASALPLDELPVTAFCLAGAALSLLAADGVTLTTGLAFAVGAIWLGLPHSPVALLVPLLSLAAICLLTPPGYAPWFDTIRAAPTDFNQATAAAMIVIAAVMMLTWFRPRHHCPTRDTLCAGVIAPLGSYLLLRLLADLSGPEIQAYWGYILMLGGSIIATLQAWYSVGEPDIDAATFRLSQRQAGLAMTGVGLALVARTADLPSAASFALAATMLSAVGSSVSGTLASLAAHSLGNGARSYRLSCLGGLIYQWPGKSTTFAVGLLGLSGMLPGVGFACLWLLLQSVLSAPRGGNLMWQVSLALTAAAIVLSSALATASAVRLVWVALLRNPSTSAEGVTDRRVGIMPLILAGLSLLSGVLPGTTVWLLAGRAIEPLTSTSPSARTGVAFLSFAITTPGYLALPVLTLLAVATGVALLVRRAFRRNTKNAADWAGGMIPPPVILPEQAERQAQHAVLTPPPFVWPQLPFSWPAALPVRLLSSVTALWVLLAGWAVLLLILALVQ